MQQAISFDTIIESGIIRIPEQYIKAIPSSVKVTVAPNVKPKIKHGANSGVGVLSETSFCALKINTSDFKFDREEANER